MWTLMVKKKGGKIILFVISVLQNPSDMLNYRLSYKTSLSYFPPHRTDIYCSDRTGRQHYLVCLSLDLLSSTQHILGLITHLNKVEQVCQVSTICSFLINVQLLVVNECEVISVGLVAYWSFATYLHKSAKA